MLQLKDIHPLTGFLRNHKAQLQRLRKTGRPEVLTVNGKARVVIQDADAYQKMLARVEAANVERTLRERWASVERGEAGVAAEDVLSDIRKRMRLRKR